MTRSPRYLILSLALAAALLLPGYATAEHHEGEPAEGAVIVGEKITRHGKVISIDAETRTVVVEGEQGRQVAIVAPADSPNFDQIKVGDPVVATYFESVALAIAPVADAEPGASGAAVVATAPKGEAPGAAMAEQIQLRAVVKAVDPATRSVTLEVPEGGERTLKAGDAIDLEKVKVGEQVSVTLTRALAISIDKE
jgi:Cu/Ag efflux protein CusF